MEEYHRHCDERPPLPPSSARGSCRVVSQRRQPQEFGCGVLRVPVLSPGPGIRPARPVLPTQKS
ncbi:hypothetical protein P7K49_038189 [Saguinus oedipus]|uniref:Uncharacterized protein n=1 Tax=Saguinus oedipus TaxID=9490 RepID=A0ABQ9TDY8_SAGOE|nr:hypothetical protein P7K49_038189 [Saguinus oedipus]